MRVGCRTNASGVDDLAPLLGLRLVDFLIFGDIVVDVRGDVCVRPLATLLGFDPGNTSIEIGSMGGLEVGRIGLEVGIGGLEVHVICTRTGDGDFLHLLVVFVLSW